MEPGGRMPAPKPLRLVQVFVNTYDALTDEEKLHSPADLTRWSARHGLPGEIHLSGDEQMEILLRFREGLRAVLAAHNGAPLSRSAVDSLNGLCETARVGVSFSAAGRPGVISKTGGVEGIIGAVLEAALSGGGDGRWERLKACPACGWVFYDHSRNRSGTWCTMAICGSRAKMKAYRRRRSPALPVTGVRP
jgi:predicted RNA-binding Zn ribbon-like protein